MASVKNTPQTNTQTVEVCANLDYYKVDRHEVGGTIRSQVGADGVRNEKKNGFVHTLNQLAYRM